MLLLRQGEATVFVCVCMRGVFQMQIIVFHYPCPDGAILGDFYYLDRRSDHWEEADLLLLY